MHISLTTKITNVILKQQLFVKGGIKLIVEIVIKNKNYIKIIKQSLEEFLDANSDNQNYFLNHTLEVFRRNIIMIVFANFVKKYSLHEPYITFINDAEYWSISSELHNSLTMKNIGQLDDCKPTVDKNENYIYLYLNTNNMSYWKG